MGLLGYKGEQLSNNYS